MSKFCSICRNTDCNNHGKNITFYGDDWECKYIPVTTNADRIRSMSDEELAEFLIDLADDGNLKIREWLQQPAGEEDKHEAD